MESIPIGLLVIDSKGEIITTNRSASEILGYTTDMLEGKGWGEIFFDTDNNVEFNQVIVDVIQEKKINLHRDTSYVRPTGETLQLSITTSFLRENGEIVGIVVLMDDVTELHRFHEREKAILEEKSRIQHERAEGLKKLALAVAHQIRNPIMSIGGFAMRMLKKPDKKDQDTVYLQNILKGANRLEDIVQAVRDYTDLPPVEPIKIPVSEILEKAQRRLRKKAVEFSKKVNWDIQIQPAEVFIDPELFERALDEVLLNALESFAGDQGRINMIVYQDIKGACIEISDTGVGISEQDKPYIFDPFFSTKAMGVGMGLCKAQRIIVEHRGEITINSSLEKGTKVTIRLPGREAGKLKDGRNDDGDIGRKNRQY